MGLYDNTIELIKKWNPSKKFIKETEFSDDLAKYLQKQMPNTRITRDDKNNKKGLDVDLKFDSMYGLESVGIELKLNLNSNTESNRLIGQIETKGKQYQSIVIVLIGDSNPNMVDILHNYIQDKTNIMRFQKNITYIQK